MWGFLKLTYINFLTLKTMNKTILIFVFSLLFVPAISQTIYVDSDYGIDLNKGSIELPVKTIQQALNLVKHANTQLDYIIKINPGIYCLDSTVVVELDNELKKNKIIIEATILPDNENWKPEKMPIIINTTKKIGVKVKSNYEMAFLVNCSNVIIRGLKFHGYYYPNTRYFAIARFNKSISNLQVEQCMFLGDKHASHLQCGLLVHGNDIEVNNCVFVNARNAVVFWQDSGAGYKAGNVVRNCIIKGATEGAVWTCTPDKNFVFENNIITDCKFAWIVNTGNDANYIIKNSIVVNNRFIKGNWEKKEEDFLLEEQNVVKQGEIELMELTSIDVALPLNYLHIVPETLGYELKAGLFKK